MKPRKICRLLVYTGREDIPGWWIFLFHVTDAAIAGDMCLPKRRFVDENTAL